MGEGSKGPSPTVIRLLEGDDFVLCASYDTGCSTWRNRVPHDFVYPPTETDTARRQAIEQQIVDYMNAPVPGKRKKTPKSVEVESEA